MASRRNDHQDGSFARKFVTWAAVLVFVIWATRNPAQAATLFHDIANAFASLASHYGKNSH